MSQMKHIRSCRFTDEQLLIVQENADAAGCPNLSEFMRRRALERPTDGIFGEMALIKEYGRSCVAIGNVIMDSIRLDPEDRQVFINAYKIALARKESGLPDNDVGESHADGI